ncbi:conserved exported hypothetical protein [Capnocytophaga canimorsus]|uniref:Uncharacterized protein n=1 Tax=Capnocytophaga canimorsus TaxID=28188 RepID=A0A0B7INF8_9FLAO|nr:hypothetical protein [Capnocytophaga canimorsus]CEN52129.1 conserved exported hypothetical protein [Capnocytophaga canimorsus]
MKYLVAFIGLICFNLSLYSQEETKESEKFVRHFSYGSFFEDGEWGEAQKSNSTFVFNINDNGDILWYRPDGNKEYFRKISRIEKGKTDDGVEYQAVGLLDEKGNEFLLALYENGVLVLIYHKDFAVRFEP